MARKNAGGIGKQAAFAAALCWFLIAPVRAEDASVPPAAPPMSPPCDVPAIDVLLLENYQGRSSTDACGVAEPATIATAAAIANAVYNAIGVRLRTLPMTPAAILAALGKVPSRS